MDKLNSTYSHVVLIHPTPRTDNDYLYTFEPGACNPTDQSCNSFCGDPLLPENPITTLQAGQPTTVYWKTNVPHAPYQYRLSLHANSSDDNFDDPDNILTIVDNAEAGLSSNAGQVGWFATNVSIPLEAVSQCHNETSPCVLQLWDLYYFVSCANIVLTEDEIPAVTNLPLPQKDDSTNPQPMPQPASATSLLIQANSFTDYKVTVGNSNATELDPILYLKRCTTYTIRVDAPGHPLVMATQPGVGLQHVLNWTSVGDWYTTSGSVPTTDNGGIEMGTFTFLATQQAPERGLYYQCTPHEEMYSSIVLVDGDPGDPDECSAVNGPPRSHTVRHGWASFLIFLFVAVWT